MKKKKPKVKLSLSKVILLSAIIIVVCIVMLTFSILFGANGSKTSVQGIGEKVPSEKTAAEAQVSDSEKQGEKQVADSKKQSEKPAEKSSQTEKPQPPVAKPSAPPKKVVPQTSSDSKSSQNTLPAEQKKTEPAKAVPPVKEPLKESPAKPDVVIPQASGNPFLVFVFDDGGQNLSQLEEFLELPFPITVAVLPSLVHSAESAQKIRASGNELMLHQPMQAVNASVNPGPGAILPDMAVDEAEQIIFKNIEEIGPVAGFNNHEGSSILENKVLTEAVLEAAIASGVYFLDSRTTSRTCAPEVALELGISIYSRDIFLDNQQTRENVLSELQKGLVIANKKGYCIMIGHVWSAALIPAILKELYPVLVEKGYLFSVVSKSGAIQ